MWNLRVGAYRLMPTHDHLLIQTAHGDLSFCPWKSRQTRNEGCGVEGIDGLVEFDGKFFVHIQAPARADRAVANSA